MKLIIDIPEIFYQNEKENKGYVSDLKRDIVWDAMINGTPLDNLRAEIEQIADEEQKHDEKWAIGLRYAVKIIDKYKAESEE